MFRQDRGFSGGLRTRKKAKTRLAVEDAALELFAEQGYEATTVEQIVARAGISVTTFFRYFRSKADVLLGEIGNYLPELCRAILARPRIENDLVAIKQGLIQAWAHEVDRERTIRTAIAVESSPLLRGIRHDVGHAWLSAIAKTLAQRSGRAKAGEEHFMSARVALVIFGGAVENWISDRCEDDLATTIDDAFAIMIQLSADWAKGGEAEAIALDASQHAPGHLAPCADNDLRA